MPNAQIQIGGELEGLEELAQELRSKGVECHYLVRTLASANVHFTANDVLQAVGDLTVITVTVLDYLKSQRNFRMMVDLEKRKMDFRRCTPEQVSKLLSAFRNTLEKVDPPKRRTKRRTKGKK